MPDSENPDTNDAAKIIFGCLGIVVLIGFLIYRFIMWLATQTS